MRVRVREKIDILGVGTDVVEMEGIFTVRRDHPCPVEGEGTTWGRSCVKTEFRALELYGESPVFGSVRVHLDPDHSSHGEVGPAAEGSLAANCVAHCYPTVEMPALGLRLTTGGEAITLASKVIQIPPVGDVARSENSAALVDDAGNVVGEIVSSDIEVGEVLWSTPIGATRTEGEPEHVHAGHDHPEPSGSQFYSRGPGNGHAHGGATTGGGHAHGGATTGGGHAHGGATRPPAGGRAQQTPPAAGAAAKSREIEAKLDKLESDLRALVAMIRQSVRA